MDTQEKALYQALDQAVDRGDTGEILHLLDQLPPAQMPLADRTPQAFAAQVLQLQEERSRTMKPSMKWSRNLLIAAAVALAVSAGAYAAVNWQQFTFQEGDRATTITTNDPTMTEQEAQELAEQADLTPEEAEKQGATVYRVEEQTYQTLAEAEADLGIPLALPEQMPDLALDTVSGYRLHEQYASLTAVYGKVEEGQAMSLSVEVQDLPEDSYALTQRDMDAGSQGSYTTPSGITYTTWSESNEDGSKTAQVLSYSRDGLEYGMAFFGFTEAQWQAVADSLDLGIYD